MTLWIIIGALVGAVAIFLVVMTIRDKKKVKIQKAEEEKLNIEKQAAGKYLIIFLIELIKKNEKTLKDFVPSVGKLKMGDIRDKAKASISSLKKGKNYRLASDSEANERIIELIDLFQKENSNNWNKTFTKEIAQLNKDIAKIDKEEIKELKSEIVELLKENYK